MTDYLDEIKERLRTGKLHQDYANADDCIDYPVADMEYLIRRLEEREHKVKESNEKLKRYKK